METLGSSVLRVCAVALLIHQVSGGQCGGNITAESGVISSPGYPDYYEINSDCTWIITVPEGYAVKLRFHDFQLEGHSGHSTCKYDFLEITDSIRTDFRIILCGSNVPSPKQTPGNRMFVHLKTDSLLEYRGFSAEFHKVSVGQCGGDITAERGVISSPGYPDCYEMNLDCTWIIAVPEGYAVSLQFHDFQLEADSTCKYDFLEIRDSIRTDSNFTTILCGSSVPCHVQIPSNRMFVHFKTESLLDYRGFSAEFQKEILDSELFCKNGGSCTLDGVDGVYRCSCTHGYEGITCQEKILCSENICKNGGTCTQDGVHGVFRCTCTNSYEGLTCEKSRSDGRRHSATSPQPWSPRAYTAYNPNANCSCSGEEEGGKKEPYYRTYDNRQNFFRRTTEDTD